MAPFSSREFGSGYAFASVQLGYVANHDDPAVHGALAVRRRAAAYPCLYPYPYPYSQPYLYRYPSP